MFKKQLKLVRKNAGFSLLEIIFAVAIFLAVSVFIFQFALNVFDYNRFFSGQAETQNQARNVVKFMVSEIRTMSPSSIGAFPLAQAINQSLIFYANIDSDPYIERIRYFLDGSAFKKGLLKPTGSPLVYNPANEKVNVLIGNLSVGADDIFSYYDASYNGTGTAMSFPIDISRVRMIGVSLSIDVDPSKEPGPLNISSKVEIRNLKDN